MVLGPSPGQWRRLTKGIQPVSLLMGTLILPSSPPLLRGPPGESPPVLVRGGGGGALPRHSPSSCPPGGPAWEQEQTLGRETSPALLMSNNLFYDRKGNCLQFHKSETNSFEVVCPGAGRRRFLSLSLELAFALLHPPPSLLITAASKLLAGVDARLSDASCPRISPLGCGWGGW